MSVTSDLSTPRDPASPTTTRDGASHYVNWTAIILGALVAAALSSILLAFGATVGLGVTSAAPTWRDSSAALWILSGIYLIIQAAISFGVGGYLAGRARLTAATADVDVEHRDGVQGLAAWALAVVIGAIIAVSLGSAAINRAGPTTARSNASAAELLLSYEIDRLFRPARRAPAQDLSQERAEAGRLLLTTSGYDGISSEDRGYLIQLVAANTGLAPAESERRVDAAIANSQTALKRSRRSSVILAFSVATALLLGAVISWAAAGIGGRHRDGAPTPEWMRTGPLHRRAGILP